jgi:hypothetical protein
VAEFFYGFGNNYAGANVSNLDVFLAALQKQAPEARVIVLVAKDQAHYVPLLGGALPAACGADPAGSRGRLEPLLHRHRGRRHIPTDHNPRHRRDRRPMEQLKKTDTHRIYKKRSGRHAVQDVKTKQWINGDDKAAILLAEG